jgi:hypothetical protein
VAYNLKFRGDKGAVRIRINILILFYCLSDLHFITMKILKIIAYIMDPLVL